MLFLEANISKGWAPMRSQLDLGNLLIVRMDGQDLSVADAEIICPFC
jgi:hypothetical protein